MLNEKIASRNRKEADYYGRGTMKGCCQKLSNAYEANAYDGSGYG